MRARRTVLLAAGVALLAGCATGPTQYEKRALTSEQKAVVARQPQVLQSLYRELFQEGRRNEVLNLMEIGATAYRHGHFDNAKLVLDRAILNIESFYDDNEKARKARSLWYEEGGKDFKGEPYERSMAYLYRGLLYLQDGDYGNAHAIFKGGLLQDAFAEEEQHRSDFAALIFLAGWAARLNGSEHLAVQYFEDYRRFRPDGPVPAPAHNVLVVVETGKSPRKLADGVGHYQLVYRRGKGFKAQRAKLDGNGLEAELYPVEDVYFQASTRGGRTVDRIIKGKVQFKRTTNTVGSTLTGLSQNNLLAGIGASAGGAVSAGFHVITAIGVAAQGISAQSKTRADTRYWESLPDTLHIYTLQTAPDVEPFTVSFQDSQGEPLPTLTQRVPVNFDPRGYGLAFASSRTQR